MKILRSLLAAGLAAFLAIFTFAAEDSATPAGQWNWSTVDFMGPVKVTARLDYKDGAIKGVVTSRNVESPVISGTLKEGKVTFTAVLSMHGMQFDFIYTGKLEGDTLTGTIDRPVPGGEREQVEWKATRTK